MKNIFPGCYNLLSTKQWFVFEEMAKKNSEIDQLTRCISEQDIGAEAFPAALSDVARLDSLVAKVKTTYYEFPSEIDSLQVNPSLEVLPVLWSALGDLVDDGKVSSLLCEECYVLVWRQEVTGEISRKQASSADLLALKIVVDGEDLLALAQNSHVPIGRIDAAIELAVQQGILLKPESKIQRQGYHFTEKKVPGKFLKAEVFTMQWHITQACDLHCKHCYDRSSRVNMSLPQGMKILDDFRRFCQDRFVDGQVSFTGGNPFLYPYFMELYQAAVDRNLGVAILGNPVPTGELETLLSIGHPAFYQVSLEGLPEHNDWIRGDGHFQRVLDFLDILKSRDIYSMVMLTLTKENQAQVLPLAGILRARADLFTFNRLSMVGEGANLQGADVAGYQTFLNSYAKEAKVNQVLALKDNMINIIRERQGESFFGGCAGFGCGAAFNFVSVLPGGEVHACRKYPSPIGNLFSDSLADIYDSEIAQRYRYGSSACEKCEIRPVCGGCPAVVYGLGKDPFNDLDPYCFF